VLLRRDDSVGFLFDLNSLLFAYVLSEHPVALQPIWRFAGDLLTDLVQLLLPATLLHFFLLFPSGDEARSPRRRRAVRLLYAPTALLGLVSSLALAASAGGAHLPARGLATFQAASGVYFAAYVCLGVALFVRAVRRARDPAERTRLAIVRFGVVVGFLPLAFVVVAEQLRPGQGPPGIAYISLSLALVPASFGYAVAKQGALELRALLRGGLLYLGLTLFLVLFYFLAVDGAGKALARRYALPEILVSFASIFLIAFTFAPLRGVLERLVDSALYPEQARTESALQRYAREVTSELQSEDILACLRRQLRETFGVHTAWLYLMQPDGGGGNGQLGEVGGDGDFPLHSMLGRYVTRHGRTLMAEYLRGSSLERHLDAGSRRFLEARNLAVVMPVPLGGTVRGVVCVPRKPNGALFTTSDAGVVRVMAQQAVLALENVALHGERFEKLRLQHELAVAHQVQAGLIPARPPALDGLCVSGRILASEEVGGDYYDFMTLDGEQLGVAVGDVAGHGVAAAILMASMQMSLRNEAKAERSPAEVMRRLNGQVSGWLAEGRFVSLFYCVYQNADRLLTYCNAGLDPPLLFRQDGRLDRLQRGGAVLGVDARQHYQDGVLKLFPDDLLVIHTDGIVEQQDARGEPFGQERLVEVVGRHLSEPLERLREHIFAAVLRFGASCMRDDMTVVLLKMGQDAQIGKLGDPGPSHA